MSTTGKHQDPHSSPPPYAYCLYPQVKQDVVGAKYSPMPETIISKHCLSQQHILLDDSGRPPPLPLSSQSYLPVIYI